MCKPCKGKGKILKTAMGTRLHTWCVKCENCEGTGLSVKEMAAVIRGSGSGGPRGHWDAGCGPDHRVWHAAGACRNEVY
jgi:hypothetical protein